MPNKFSIVTVFWGDHTFLHHFIKTASKWSDDIVVVYIDLYGKRFSSKKAKVITIDHNFLLDNGYAATFNLGIDAAQYDWTYIIGVDKQILSLNENILNNLDKTNKAGFLSIYEDNFDGTKWIKFSHRERARLTGEIHEEPVAVAGFDFGYEVFASWSRTDSQNPGKEDLVSKGYRALSRLKWYYLFNNKIKTDGPPSFHNSMRFLTNLWGEEGIKEINALYEKHQHLYGLARKDLVKELMTINDWDKYSL